MLNGSFLFHEHSFSIVEHASVLKNKQPGRMGPGCERSVVTDAGRHPLRTGPVVVVVPVFMAESISVQEVEAKRTGPREAAGRS